MDKQWVITQQSLFKAAKNYNFFSVPQADHKKLLVFYAPTHQNWLYLNLFIAILSEENIFFILRLKFQW